jgi:tetratricopeptide (TPR) repeat protein
MKTFQIILTILLAAMLWNCGSDPMAEAEEAFRNGDYSKSIRLFTALKKEQPMYSKGIDEKIALSYMLRGKELYEKTRNVQSFSGNLEKAGEFIPQSPSDEFNLLYADILVSLADAYMNAVPANDIEKESFLSEALADLQKAQTIDPGNASADSLMQKFRRDHFEDMKAKAYESYQKAQKMRDLDYYFISEYYVKKASDFDPNDQDLRNLLTKIREKTISVLNYRDQVSLAIADKRQQKGQLIFDVTIKNYLPTPVKLDVSRFRLVGRDGTEYPMDTDMMNIFLKGKSLENQELNDAKPMVDGLLVFKVPPDTRLAFLEYRYDNRNSSRKYFP